MSDISGNWTCSKDQFKCHLSYCIEKSQVCDGVIDCKMTYVDELNCSKYYKKCQMMFS